MLGRLREERHWASRGKQASGPAHFANSFGSDLIRHFTSEFRVPGTPHRAHTTPANGRQGRVASKLGAGFHWMNQTTLGVQANQAVT